MPRTRKDGDASFRFMVSRGIEMSLAIELSGDLERRLTLLAEREGKSLPEFAAGVLRSVANEDSEATAESIDVILAPFRKQVAESGMSEDELDAFFQDLRQEFWEEESKDKLCNKPQ